MSRGSTSCPNPGGLRSWTRSRAGGCWSTPEAAMSGVGWLTWRRGGGRSEPARCPPPGRTRFIWKPAATTPFRSGAPLPSEPAGFIAHDPVRSACRAAAAGTSAHRRRHDLADPVELLGRPRVVITGDSARISYPAVIWTPGPQQIQLPGPLLLGPGGKVDSLPGDTVRIAVRSVLPRGVPDSLIRPQPRATLVIRRDTSPVPLIILWSLALALLVPVHLWWRRRGKPVPVALTPQELPDPPLDRWADDGEYRAVANVAAVRLRTALAQRVAGAHPGLDTERLLAELAAVRPD